MPRLTPAVLSLVETGSRVTPLRLNPRNRLPFDPPKGFKMDSKCFPRAFEVKKFDFLQKIAAQEL
jgi:hypothetical protein